MANTNNTKGFLARLLNLATPKAEPITMDAMDDFLSEAKDEVVEEIKEATYEVSGTFGINFPFSVQKNAAGDPVGYLNSLASGPKGQGMIAAQVHVIETKDDAKEFFRGPIGKLPSWGMGRTGDDFAVPVDTYVLAGNTENELALQKMIAAALTEKGQIEEIVKVHGVGLGKSMVDAEGNPALINSYVYGRAVVDARLRVGAITVLDKAASKKAGKAVRVEKPICEILVTRVRMAEVAHPRRHTLDGLEAMVLSAVKERSSRLLDAVQQGAEAAVPPKAADIDTSEEEVEAYETSSPRN